MKHMVRVFVLSVGLIVVLSGCLGILGGDDGDGGSGTAAQPGGVLSFNLSGAAAIGTAEISASASDLTGSALLTGSTSPSESAFGLVKILDDGSVEMAMSAPDGVWLPQVQFIATTPDPDNNEIYVSFQGPMNFWDPETGENTIIGSFLHIYPDGTYYDVMPSTSPDNNGHVRNYTWYGDDSYKPVAFDQAGNVYFVWETWNSSGNIEVLYKYDPTTHLSTPLTAQLSGYHYNSFQVSPNGDRLYVQGQRNSAAGTSANFFRMYPTADMTNPKTVYYSSNSNVWVRGYILAEDGTNVIMNGYNIRGINGILRANIISNTEITYDSLFDSNSGGFSPSFSSWYSDWEDRTYVNGLFDYIDGYDTYVLMTTGSQFVYMRAYDAFMRTPGETVYTMDSLGGSWSWTYKYSDLKFATDPANVSEILTVPNGAGTVWSQLVAAGTSGQVIVGYSKLSYSSSGTTYSFIQASGALRDALAGNPSGYYCDWNAYWLDDAGNLDVAAVESYLARFFVANATFSYNSQTGADAWSTFFNERPYIQTDIYGPNWNSEYFLSNYMKDANTGQPAVTLQQFRTDNNLPWLDFANVGTMFRTSNGDLWGVLGGSWNASTLTPIRLLDAQGNKSLAVIQALSGSSYRPVGFAVDGDHLYFRDAVLDSDGFELGYHRMYRIDLSNPDALPVDVLTGFGASNGRIEIVDFSVGGGFFYFTAVDRIQLVGGKVNTTTLEYTPFNNDYVISNIEVY